MLMQRLDVIFTLLNFLILQNILKKAEENSEREANAIKAHQQLEQVSISWVLYTGWAKRSSKAVEGWYQNDDE